MLKFRILLAKLFLSKFYFRYCKDCIYCYHPVGSANDEMTFLCETGKKLIGIDHMLGTNIWKETSCYKNRNCICKYFYSKNRIGWKK